MTTATPGTGPRAPVDVPPDAGRPDFGEALPSWFATGLVVALSAVVGFGTVGLVLAIIGIFVPALTLPLGALATFGLVVAVAPWRFTSDTRPQVQWPAIGAVVVAAGATALAMRHHAQHVLLDRDPGGYVLTGRWLASHHNLEFHARVGAFAHTTGLQYSSPAVYEKGGGVLYFQFSHLLPVLLAQARWIGGDRLLFFTPPLLGGLGLLALYALATRFVRPWLALAAAAALAADLVEMHFMRDAFSELPTQVVLLGALWLLTRREVPRRPLAFLVGLLFGATVMARIDGPLYLVVIPFVLGAAVVAHRRGDADGRARLDAAWWLAGGAVLTTVIGYLDVRLRSPRYVHDLGSRVTLQYVGLAVACIVAIGVARALPGLVPWPARALRGRLPDVAAIVAGLTLLAAWFVRPHVQHTRGPAHPLIRSLQRIDGVAIDATRRYYEDSLRWHSWYLGPLTLLAAIAGIAILVRAVLRGRAGMPGLVVTAFLPVAAVYLWNANIFPDQIWVMRRFLPLVIPGFVLFSFVVVEALLRAAVARGDRGALGLAARGGAVVLAVAAIAWPLRTDWRVRGDTAQRGFLGPVTQLCRTIGSDGAVVVLQGGTLELVLPQTLRSYCDVPVAIRIWDPPKPALDPAGFGALAAAWQRDGRALYVVADSADRIDHIIPGLRPIATFSAFDNLYLQERILHRPTRFRTEAYTFVVARVPAAP